MDIEKLIETVVLEIKKVEGVSAIVLGGSRARGTHTPKSDIDLGIYYRPLDLKTLNHVAAQLDDDHRPQILTPLGGWGPWINGGGWLAVNTIPVDFLYRDLTRVAGVVDSCQKGQVEIFYQPGHPHGFVSSMYMSEIAICKLLWESERQEVSTLKTQTTPYPVALRRALIDKFAWEIDFSLGIASKSVSRSDTVYAAGCCFRAAACMLQCLFALNEQYWLNEKGAVALAETFPFRPPDFRARMESVFTALAADSQAISTAIDILAGLSADTAQLVTGNLREK
jgi:hypothetical protein